MKLLLPLFALALSGCATVPAPTEAQLSASEILERSVDAQAGGVSRVEVAFEGDWKFFAKATQPVLTDTDFRQDSVERYRPGSWSVDQTHTGPGGDKRVRHRTNGSTTVTYNGSRSQEAEAIDAAALVGDAYQLFLFGARYAKAHGRGFNVTGSETISGHMCYRIEGTVPGGFGNSDGDLLRLSIDAETYVCRRVYFSINGLASTRGAEVDVTMSDFIAAPDGSLWPTHFYERVRKPVNAPAHLWVATSLVVDGQRVR